MLLMLRCPPSISSKVTLARSEALSVRLSTICSRSGMIDLVLKGDVVDTLSSDRPALVLTYPSNFYSIDRHKVSELVVHQVRLVTSRDARPQPQGIADRPMRGIHNDGVPLAKTDA